MLERGKGCHENRAAKEKKKMEWRFGEQAPSELLPDCLPASSLCVFSQGEEHSTRDLEERGREMEQRVEMCSEVRL